MAAAMRAHDGNVIVGGKVSSKNKSVDHNAEGSGAAVGVDVNVQTGEDAEVLVGPYIANGAGRESLDDNDDDDDDD